MSSDACVKCYGHERWLVSPVRERAAPGWSELGGLDGIAPMTATICRACGHTDWRCPPTAGLFDEPARRRHVVDDRIRCRDCAGVSHLLVAQLHEQASDEGFYFVAERRLAVAQGAGGGGRFALLVCDGCGLVDWFAWDVSQLAGRACDDACDRCGSRRMSSVSPVKEEDGRPLFVALVDGSGAGQFEVRWCSDCGACDWRAHRLDELRPDGKSIVIASADVRPRVPVAGGPYR